MKSIWWIQVEQQQELCYGICHEDIKTLYQIYKVEGEGEIVQTKKEKVSIGLLEIQKLFQENSSPYIIFGYKHYLMNRKFNPEEINKEWGVCGGIEIGEYNKESVIWIKNVNIDKKYMYYMNTYDNRIKAQQLCDSLNKKEN